MANRYLRAAGGNWNAAGSWELTSGGGEAVAVPVAADEVYLVVGSGQLTINASAYCRRFDCTGYANVITHNNSCRLTIGDTVAPTGLVAMILAGTYTPGTLAEIAFSSTAAGVHTIDTGGKTLRNLYLWGTSSYKFLNNNITVLTSFNQSGGTVDLNNLALTTGNIVSAHVSAVMSLILGSSIININIGGVDMGGTNWSTPANTAKFIFTSAGVTLTTVSLPLNLNGASFYIQGGAGSFTNNGYNVYINDLIITPTTSKTIITYAGKTLFVAGQFVCYPKAGIVTFTGGTISKASGTIKLYQVTIGSTVFTGGATWEAYHNSTVPNGCGMTRYDTQFCMDYINAVDTVFAAYGWWKVDYTGASGTCPIEGEEGIGATSGKHCKVTGMIDDYDWSLGIGTLFFYGKTGTFVGETVNFTNGGSIVIAGDLTGSAWSTIQTSKYTNRDALIWAKSPDPTSMGQNAQWTSTTIQGGGIAAAITPTSSTNAAPIHIVKTAAFTSYVTGDIIHLYGHTVNTNANGIWFITKVSNNEISLDDSIGNGVGGATGYLFKVTSKAVVLTSAVTTDVCLCDVAWTPGTNVTSANLQTGYWKFGAGCPTIITGASCGANQILAKFGLGASIDLSTKKQISFWFYNVGTAVATGSLLLKLYSDSACTAEVESFAIPAIPTYGNWIPFTINKGTALSGTVQGVALYTTIAQPSKQFFIDNIIACGDATDSDSLTLNSLISKNIADQNGDDIFIGIQSIKGRIILLDNGAMSNANAGRGYYGLTEAPTLYKRESIVISLITSALYNFTKAGAVDYHCKYLGGYDPLTKTKNGLTVFDSRYSVPPGMYCYNAINTDIDNFQFVRFLYGIQYGSLGGVTSNVITTNCYYGIQTQANSGINVYQNCSFLMSIYHGFYGYGVLLDASSCNLLGKGNLAYGLNFFASGAVGGGMSAENNGNGGIFLTNYSFSISEVISANYNNGAGIYINSMTYTVYIESILQCNYNLTGLSINSNTIVSFGVIAQLNYNATGISYNANKCTIREITQFNNSNTVMIATAAGSNLNILKITSADSNQALISPNSQGAVNIFIYNANFSNWISVTPLNIPYGEVNLINCDGLPVTIATGTVTGYNYKISIHNYNNTLNDHRSFYDGGAIVSDSTERHTASGISWKFSVVSVGRSLLYPIIMPISKVLCDAGVPVTVGLWVKKSSATDIGGRLVVVGNKYEGVGSIASDVYMDAPDITTWNQITITFTPTKTEVIEVEFWAFWVAGLADETIWIDDIAVVV